MVIFCDSSRTLNDQSITLLCSTNEPVEEGVVLKVHLLLFLVLRVYLDGGSNHLTNYTTQLERIRMSFRGCLLWPPTLTQLRTTSIHFLSLFVR